MHHNIYAQKQDGVKISVETYLTETKHETKCKPPTSADTNNIAQLLAGWQQRKFVLPM